MEEVLMLQIQQEKGGRQAALEPVKHPVSLGRVQCPRAHFEGEGRVQLGGAPGTDGQGSEASSRKAVVNGEWTSGVSSASNTQVSR